jgi:hypothetical protein
LAGSGVAREAPDPTIAAVLAAATRSRKFRRDGVDDQAEHEPRTSKSATGNETLVMVSMM